MAVYFRWLFDFWDRSRSVQRWTTWRAFLNKSGLTNSAKSSSTHFFISIVIAQWVDAIVCKIHHNSLLRQSMINWTLNADLFLEIALACLMYPEDISFEIEMMVTRNTIRYHHFDLFWGVEEIAGGIKKPRVKWDDEEKCFINNKGIKKNKTQF